MQAGILQTTHSTGACRKSEDTLQTAIHFSLDLAHHIIVNLALNLEYTKVLKWSLNSLNNKSESQRSVFHNKLQEIKKSEYLVYWPQWLKGSNFQALNIKDIYAERGNKLAYNPQI